MYMHTYTQTYIYTYTYIYTCTIHTYYTHIHAHTNTYACICTRIHRQKILATMPQRVKQYHRRAYASICICMHTHTYIHMHICAQSAASEFADVYVGVKTHLCNIHTCPCTSAQNTCKVHVTLTAKTCTYTHAYIYIHHVRTNTHIQIYTHTRTKCTYERTQSTSEMTARQRLRGKPDLTPRIFALLPVRCNPEGDTLRGQQPNSPSTRNDG